MMPVSPSSPAPQPARPLTSTMAALEAEAWTPRRSAPTEAELRERLLPRTPLRLSRLWLLPLLSILLGAFLRFWHLGLSVCI